MFAQNYMFFYILSFFLILMAFLILFLPRFYQMIVAAILFFLGISILYFGFNSLFLGFLQIFIYIAAIITLLIIGYRATKKTDEKKYSFTDKKFVLSILMFVIIIAMTCLLLYYFSKVPNDYIMTDFWNKNEFSLFVSFFVTAKALFTEYFLAYGLVIITFISVLTGVSILIAKEKKVQDIEGENNNG